MEQSGIADARKSYRMNSAAGMRRRVAIARALAYAGALFLLDEPFKALDDTTRAKMIAWTMQSIGKKPTILVTHELTEAAAMANTVLLLNGRLCGLSARFPSRSLFMSGARSKFKFTAISWIRHAVNKTAGYF